MEIYNDTYCVYIHINKINNKKYIGQTIYGNNPNKRWIKGKGYRHCPKFYNAIQKYGWDNFEHEIIASNLTEDEANNFEELLIKKLNTTNSKNGYNLQYGGEHNLHSLETKQKMSKGRKGKSPSKEHRKHLSDAIKGEKHFYYGKHHTEEEKKNLSINSPKNKSVLCVETNTTYRSMMEAQRATGINNSLICNCCKGKKKTAGGYHWRYANEVEQENLKGEKL